MVSVSVLLAYSHLSLLSLLFPSCRQQCEANARITISNISDSRFFYTAFELPAPVLDATVLLQEEDSKFSVNTPTTPRLLEKY